MFSRVLTLSRALFVVQSYLQGSREAASMVAEQPSAKRPTMPGRNRSGLRPFDWGCGYLDDVALAANAAKDKRPGKSKQAKNPRRVSSQAAVAYPTYPIGATWPKRRSSMTSPRSSSGARFSRPEQSKPPLWAAVEEKASMTSPRSSSGARFSRPEQSKPPLWAAVEEKDEHAVRTLLSWGEDVNVRYKAWTPLMKAAEEGSRAILHLLLDHRASIDASNSRGRTALSFAAAPSMRRPTQLLTLAHLLTAGADITLRDNNGLTARGWAEKELRWDAVAMLGQFARTAKLDVLAPTEADALADAASAHAVPRVERECLAAVAERTLPRAFVDDSALDRERLNRQKWRSFRKHISLTSEH